jgi:hypothetical protein
MGLAMSWRKVRTGVASLRGVLGAGAIALAGCPTVDLGEPPPAPGLCRPDLAYYRDVVWPEFLAPAAVPTRSCVAASGCHQRANGRSALRLIAAEPLAQTDHQANYDVVTRFLNCGTPEASSLLIKPLGGIEPHGGGDVLTPGGAEEMTFLLWFQQ